MVDDMKDPREFRTWTVAMKRWRRVAWMVILIADAGLLAWGAMAALVPGRLLGPGTAPILAAGYESFTKRSWSVLRDTSPMTTEFITLLFRMFGVGNVEFALLAIVVAATTFRRGDRWAWWALLVGNTIAFGAPMTYDRIVGAIGPFEILEYVGIAGIYLALAVTAPFLAARRPGRRTG
jgi:hypothetical protein